MPSPGLGLGHRRLAIIDPTGGEQPMFNEDGSVAIVFNGMIYNYRELMALLQGRGHVFRTKCDTETIVHAWEEWGPDCVQHLNGFFAFAIWDRRRGQLFLARDRLGKKPLHYAKLADGSLAFSSELSSFAQVPGLARKVSATAVDDFFTYGYIPDPGTIYEGILKLPAAHSLLVERGSRRVVPQRYWSVPTATATSAGNGDSNRRLTLTTCPGASATEGERHLTENSSWWFPVGTRGSQPPGNRDCCVVGAWWSWAEAGAEADDGGPSRRWCFDAAAGKDDDDDDVAIDFSAAKRWPCSIGTAGAAWAPSLPAWDPSARVSCPAGWCLAAAACAGEGWCASMALAPSAAAACP